MYQTITPIYTHIQSLESLPGPLTAFEVRGIAQATDQAAAGHTEHIPKARMVISESDPLLKRVS